MTPSPLAWEQGGVLKPGLPGEPNFELRRS